LEVRSACNIKDTMNDELATRDYESHSRASLIP